MPRMSWLPVVRPICLMMEPTVRIICSWRCSAFRLALGLLGCGLLGGGLVRVTSRSAAFAAFASSAAFCFSKAARSASNFARSSASAAASEASAAWAASLLVGALAVHGGAVLPHQGRLVGQNGLHCLRVGSPHGAFGRDHHGAIHHAGLSLRVQARHQCLARTQLQQRVGGVESRVLVKASAVARTVFCSAGV